MGLSLWGFGAFRNQTASVLHENCPKHVSITIVPRCDCVRSRQALFYEFGLTAALATPLDCNQGQMLSKFPLLLLDNEDVKARQEEEEVWLEVKAEGAGRGEARRCPDPHGPGGKGVGVVWSGLWHTQRCGMQDLTGKL